MRDCAAHAAAAAAAVNSAAVGRTILENKKKINEIMTNGEIVELLFTKV